MGSSIQVLIIVDFASWWFELLMTLNDYNFLPLCCFHFLLYLFIQTVVRLSLYELFPSSSHKCFDLSHKQIEKHRGQ